MRQSHGKVGAPGQPLAPRSQPPHWPDPPAPVPGETDSPAANFVTGNKSTTQSLPMPTGPALHQISKQGWARLLAPPGRCCAAARAAQPTIAPQPSSRPLGTNSRPLRPQSNITVRGRPAIQDVRSADPAPPSAPKRPVQKAGTPHCAPAKSSGSSSSLMGHCPSRGPLKAGSHGSKSALTPHLNSAGRGSMWARPHSTLRRPREPALSPAMARGPTAAQHLLQQGAASLQTPECRRERHGAHSARIHHYRRLGHAPPCDGLDYIMLQ
ncbi:hypothetical protein NDU88_009443 [Pleurodeles waltl]|uniref:Uncharacterized protein n=1 Tax=Pleurodeles waltl TaxID=8319 RepID=A0AAV7S0H0_PLEWA|nr:hypothetical protein NDU88_009443 [Pleurodeles waltl]